MSKKNIILILLIITALILGWYWYATQRTETQNENNGQQVVEIVEPEYTSEELLAMEWETYTNDELGFSVKYPRAWDVNYENRFDYSYIISFFENEELPRINVRLSKSPSELDYKRSQVSREGESIKTETFTTNDMTINKYIVHDEKNNKLIYIYSFFKDTSFTITASVLLEPTSTSKVSSYEEVFDRFVKSISLYPAQATFNPMPEYRGAYAYKTPPEFNGVYTAEDLLEMEWETYTNKEFGFSVKYPRVFDVYDNLDKKNLSSYLRFNITKPKNEGSSRVFPISISIKISQFVSQDMFEEDKLRIFLDKNSDLLEHRRFQVDDTFVEKFFTVQDKSLFYKFFIFRENTLYEIVLSHYFSNMSENDYGEVMEQIVKSFTFSK